jgi:GntR family transcriptional regulator, transcriptional repressor for pyruvate dehydrogenase complex
MQKRPAPVNARESGRSADVVEAANIPIAPPGPARPRHNLAHGVVKALKARILDGRMRRGDKLPTEAEAMREFGVSRTVVREALSKLQAGGMVRTRHGIGTFVLGEGRDDAFGIAPDQIATAREVIAVLELRIGLETEAAALAAVRRTEANLDAMRQLLAAFSTAITDHGDALVPDFQFHLEVARATQNVHFAELMNHLGTMIIPRLRLDTAKVAGEGRIEYLQRVNIEHENIVSAISNRDSEGARAAMRTHLANSRDRLRRAHDAVGI